MKSQLLLPPPKASEPARVSGISLNRVVSKKLVALIGSYSLVKQSFKVSPDIRRMAYTAQARGRLFVVVDGKEGKEYDAIGKDSPIFSPDSRRVAYAARMGNKHFMVVDRMEQKSYDGIGGGSLIFSPDSKRVAYTAQVGLNWVRGILWFWMGMRVTNMTASFRMKNILPSTPPIGSITLL
jgi:hypothetical protein